MPLHLNYQGKTYAVPLDIEAQGLNAAAAWVVAQYDADPDTVPPTEE